MHIGIFYTGHIIKKITLWFILKTKKGQRTKATQRLKRE